MILENIKYCPVCKSEKVNVLAGKEVERYKCSECGFSGALFPEKEAEGAKSELEEEEKDEDSESEDEDEEKYAEYEDVYGIESGDDKEKK